MIAVEVVVAQDFAFETLAMALVPAVVSEAGEDVAWIL